ncbi:hypothetical protein LNP05_29540 [Klebsiella pneumoniae subsp. pneumoniae]|nr:hypothetical protein [Klebsiella pneumoniae subsp. pneumoniae]
MPQKSAPAAGAGMAARLTLVAPSPALSRAVLSATGGACPLLWLAPKSARRRGYSRSAVGYLVVNVVAGSGDLSVG